MISAQILNKPLVQELWNWQECLSSGDSCSCIPDIEDLELGFFQLSSVAYFTSKFKTLKKSHNLILVKKENV